MVPRAAMVPRAGMVPGGLIAAPRVLSGVPGVRVVVPGRLGLIQPIGAALLALLVVVGRCGTDGGHQQRTDQHKLEHFR